MRSKQFLLLLVNLLFCLSGAHSQNTDEATWKYLGQTPPKEVPIPFAPGIVSTAKLEHSSPAFSLDGREIFWSAIALPLQENRKKIWTVRYEQGKWTAPQIASFSGKDEDDGPVLSWDEEKIYFASKRRKVNFPDSISTDRWTLYSHWDIWSVKRGGNQWAEPQRMAAPVTTDRLEAQISFTNDGTMYYLSFMEGVEQECGIYRSAFVDGKYMDPEPLPASINSSAQDWTPFIAPDESYLIFSSNRTGGKDYYGDLYISFFQGNNTWTKPQNIGDKINTSSQERFPSVSPDGKYLFFTRYNGKNNQDVFWVEAKIIEELRPN